jgi:hypothetical protein
MGNGNMNILQPNQMGFESLNTGLESLTGNYGLGMAELQKANQKSEEERSGYVTEGLEKLRRHKAREFGLTKETVGF